MSRTAQRYRLLKGSYQQVLSGAWGNIDQALELLKESRCQGGDQAPAVEEALERIWNSEDRR